MQTLVNPSYIPESRKTIYIHDLKESQLSFFFDRLCKLSIWALTTVQSCQDLDHVSMSQVMLLSGHLPMALLGENQCL